LVEVRLGVTGRGKGGTNVVQGYEEHAEQEGDDEGDEFDAFGIFGWLFAVGWFIGWRVYRLLRCCLL
jgi:hypothetical protein